MLKKLLSALLALTMCICTLVSCGSLDNKDEKIKILCTVFPLYDWAKNVASGSEGVEVSLLVENGTDLHSFQPTFRDMAKIKDSDIVIFIGGESDKWVAESIDERALSIELSALDEVVLYEASDDRFAAGHTHEDGEECREAHGHAFDEHIWLSLSNAEASCRAILDMLCKSDAENSELYTQNFNIYKEKLDALDTKMSALAENISSPVIFADRFPFVYFFEDYGIDYFAAFSGCSTDTNADFDTVITLARKIDEYESSFVFVTERPIDGLAESIIKQTAARNAEIILLDSMQSLAISDIEGGISYISVMEQSIDKIARLFN